jgi:hypothetical protein
MHLQRLPIPSLDLVGAKRAEVLPFSNHPEPSILKLGQLPLLVGRTVVLIDVITAIILQKTRKMSTSLAYTFQVCK